MNDELACVAQLAMQACTDMYHDHELPPVGRRPRLEAALLLLSEGKPLQVTHVRGLLTRAEFAEYRLEMSRCLPQFTTELRDRLRGRLQVYEQRLRRADQTWVRAERLSYDGSAFGNAAKKAKARALFRETDRLYEAALEALSEAIADEPSALLCLDRAVSIGIGGCYDSSLCISDMPRPFWSPRASKAQIGTTTLLEIQRNAVRSALYKVRSVLPRRLQ